MTLLRDFSCSSQNQGEEKYESLPLADTVQKSVPVMSIWGMISVTPVGCCSGTPLENAALSDLLIFL